MVFAIHQHELAIGIHVSPPAGPPGTSLSTQSSVLSQGTGFGCPVSCVEFALVTYFTYANVHMQCSMLFSQITPPSSSLSPKVCSLCLCPLTMFLSSVLKVKHISQIFYYYTFFFGI